MTHYNVENEVLSTVYGFAGFYAWYRDTKIGSIAFVLYDTETQESRTVGVRPSPILRDTRGSGLILISIAVWGH